MTNVIDLRDHYWIPESYPPGSAVRGFRFSGQPIPDHRNPTVAEFEEYRRTRGYEEPPEEGRLEGTVGYLVWRKILKRVA